MLGTSAAEGPLVMLAQFPANGRLTKVLTTRFGKRIE